MIVRTLLLGLLLILWSMMPAKASVQSAGNAAAAKNAAATSPACRELQPFYWEIGTKDAVVASGSEGDGSVSRDTVLSIASASKMVFGAYVIQKEQGKIDSATAKFLHMSSGYVSLRALLQKVVGGQLLLKNFLGVDPFARCREAAPARRGAAPCAPPGTIRMRIGLKTVLEATAPLAARAHSAFARGSTRAKLIME